MFVNGSVCGLFCSFSCGMCVVIILGIGGFVRWGLNFFCQGKQLTSSVLSSGGSLFVVFLFFHLFVLSEELSVANSWEVFQLGTAGVLLCGFKSIGSSVIEGVWA